MKKLIGIDDIEVYPGKIFLELVPEKKVNGEYLETEFSRSRGFAPSYLAEGIGAYQFGWLDGREDTVTAGLMASKEIIERNDIKLSEIGRVYVGTETPVDHSKPNAMYTVGALERSIGKEGEMKNCTPLDLKFACAGATAGLELMNEWIDSGKNNGKCGLIIAEDNSIYPLKSREEVTQGFGAVVMLVKENPRLLALENNMTTEIMSTVCRDEKDFFRPVNKHTAVVDGPLSIDSYLDVSKTAFIDCRKKAIAQGFIKDGEILTDKIDRILLHLPFYKMGEYGAIALFKYERRNTPVWKEIEKVIGPEPKKEDRKASKEFDKKLRETELFKEFFSKKIEKGLQAVKKTGNLYNGSLYASFDSMLELELKEGTDLVGKICTFGSYASGAMFKACIGTIQPEYKEVVRKLNLFKKLDERKTDKRKSLSLKDYERLHEKNLGITESVIPPENEFVLANIGSSKVDEGYRYYKFVD